MAQRSRKLQPHAGATKRVSRKKPRTGWLSSTLAIAILLSSAGLVVAFTWLSILFIFNPQQVGWLNKFLPAWAQIPLGYSESPQTLSQIREQLSHQKRFAGETLPLNDGENSFLLPIFQQRGNCQSDCQEIVELRVYQYSPDVELRSRSEKSFRLVNHLPVTGLTEGFVVTPVEDITQENPDLNTLLPLNKVKRFADVTPTSGVWFDLQGKYQKGTKAFAYGHIVYYNSERTNLQQLLSWKSPSGQLPKWQQVTGSDAKELVIDQTVGLEPQLSVYQVKPVKLYLNPIQLEAIALKSPAFKDSAYENALSIARSGLWTPAWEWLQFIQKQRQKTLPAAAKAQIDLIRWHAQLTKAQADKTWASPSQQVLADLIDGRWQKALNVFTVSSQNTQEIATLLKADTGRLWNRVVAALRVNPERPEVQAWGALILAVQKGEDRANSWLKTQPKITPANITYIQSLLKRLQTEVGQSPTSSHPSQILGTVKPISQINPSEWLQISSQDDLKLTDRQVWYQVTVSTFHDGKRWLKSPFDKLAAPKSSPAKFLWATLGITSDPIIQIIVWLANGEQETTTATIKGVQLQNGILRLLTAGGNISENQNHDLQPSALALTDNTLAWVQPSPITLAELHRQDSPAVAAMLPILWRSLQQSGEIPAGNIPNFSQIQAQTGHWPVQVIDLTNNAKPEIVLTLSKEAIASLNKSKLATPEPEKNLYRPRTFIFSDNGKVIYTDFQKSVPQTLIAIAQLGDKQSLALLVERESNYSLQRWSDKNQRFE